MGGYGPRGDKPRNRDGGVSRIIGLYDIEPGSGSIVISANCDALIYAFGGGGSGGGEGPGGVNAGGGGGGAALFKRLALRRGQTLVYSVGPGGASSVANGNAGGATTVTLNSTAYTAGGGQGGLAFESPGAGGVAVNGDLNRAGGSGGVGASGGGGAGQAGEFGAAGGAQEGGRGGGGGAAGFSDLDGTRLLGGAGSNANSAGSSAAGTAPGGGSGGSGSGSGAAGAGRLVVVLVAR